MSQYEYKVVPAPKKGLKAKGIKSAENRYANALETAMNALGAEGWEYQRSETLPSEERSGLTRRVTTFQNMLVFRRAVAVDVSEPTVVEIVEDNTTPTVTAEVDESPLLEAKPLDVDPARAEPQVAAE
ncbi:MAG: DUF4177 domain-containing protein [Rhodobacterales bacterium]|jgi:hypothetical protein|tara:strand:- start:1759 stop:2142 length:384 start_codon:yes stop_codon:yes gene_type:complete